jgi:epoxyqueuosine reductase
MVETGGSELDQSFARSRLRVRGILVAKDLDSAVLVYANRFHGQNPRMTGGELNRLAGEIGLDVVGAARAEPYEETERHIHERRQRGLFADMRFTMSRPDVSCHPERLFAGARSVVAAAACYFVPGPEVGVDEGRLPRYTWRDEYALLRQRLDVLGRRLGGTYRVLVDEPDHVDREAAVRAGIAFYGKNTMAITRRFGSWVVLGALVSDVEIEPSSRLDAGCGECTLCIDACPTRALDEPGVLDATKCLSYWTQAPHSTPEQYREDLGTMVYGCDVCQDVCPWNRGIEKRRRETLPAEEAQPVISLLDWLERSGEDLVADFDRLYVPRNDPRWLRRNALVVAGNSGGSAVRPSVERYTASDDPMLAETAAWALARLEGRSA